MRQDCYELLVLGGDGVKFEECELDGKSFVRAEPGKEYKVKFIIHRNASGCFPFLHAKCVLTVDGTAVDNGRFFDLDPSRAQYCCLFSGFRISADTIQALMFSEVAVGTADSTTHSDTDAKAGLLQVTVFEMERSDQLANVTYNSTLVAPAVSTVSENKKFWQQPSLATTRGREMKVSTSLAKYIYKKLRQVPDVTVEVQCHTGGVLDFLRDQHNKLHPPAITSSSAAPVNTQPLHIDLSAEPDVVPSVALPPVVEDLRFQDQEEVSGKTQVKIEKKRRSGRGSAYKPDADTMVVDLMQDEEEKVVEVKVEKKSRGKHKGGNKKKRAVGVGLDSRGAFKKARGADGTGGADASGDVVATKD